MDWLECNGKEDEILRVGRKGFVYSGRVRGSAYFSLEGSGSDIVGLLWLQLSAWIQLKRMSTLDCLAQVPCESCSGIPRALRKWNRRSHAGGSTVTPSQVANSAIISTNQRFLPHKSVGLKGREYGEGYRSSSRPLCTQSLRQQWATDRACHVGSCGKARFRS